MLFNFDILDIDQGRAKMSCLQGYVEADYNTLVEVFGEPHYNTPSADEKVNTEWELRFEVQEEGEEDTDIVYATIYDWRDYDGGMTSRSGAKYNWHIGGDNNDAVDAVKQAIKNYMEAN
jgi:hypothetical protein